MPPRQPPLKQHGSQTCGPSGTTWPKPSRGPSPATTSGAWTPAPKNSHGESRASAHMYRPPRLPRWAHAPQNTQRQRTRKVALKAQLRKSGPRAGGGVPRATGCPTRERSWSPRRRGCSGRTRRRRPARPVVPAQAGVFRPPCRPDRRRLRGPRAGGGVPWLATYQVVMAQWSPRRRGCSGGRSRSRPRAAVVPAQAGVFRTRPPHGQAGGGGPRAGGGVPGEHETTALAFMWSPRRRGCSDMPALRLPDRRVVPAQAGVFRGSTVTPGAARRGPRAGGGVPQPNARSADSSPWSPRRRGCSARVAGLVDAEAVVPAQAGVFRGGDPDRGDGGRGPRAGGGVPMGWPELR